MKTAIIGGGKGCVAILDLARGPFLRELTIDVMCVADLDPDAAGMRRARELGIPTSSDPMAVLAMDGLELVIELTGRDRVVDEILEILPPGVRLIDHTIAHVFWDLAKAQQEQEWHLVEITTLEEKIETERRFLQSLFDTIPELVVVFDTHKKIVRTNAAFLKFAGLTSDAIIGTSCQDLLAATELAAARQEIGTVIDEVLRTGKARTLIWQTAHPREAYWEVIHTPILGKNGVPEGAVGTWHRITEKIMLVREIEQAEQQFKAFIDSANDWISIKNLEGRYVIVNPACAHAFGLQPQDFTGRKPEEILSPEAAEIIRRHDADVIENSQYYTYDEVFHLAGGDRHLHTVRFPLTDYRGDVAGVCTIARDVTAERELNEQLVQAAKLAAVGKLAAGVAHEINNPLTGILAFAEDLLADLPDIHPHRHDLGVIARETIRCREIVRNLLDFARLENLVLERRDPNQVVRETLVLIHKLPQFRNIKIVTELADVLPQVECDLPQLQQVLLNLMMNAAEAMNGQGTIVLHTEYEYTAERCLISVRDKGPGIPDELHARIFEPFFSTKGTNGLGLAVSWGIVERHRGTIEVANAPSGGAVFLIRLPVAGAGRRVS
ncbi:MAG: PAS domain-containing protein [Candidatus Zixiibacteriota bacterium]